MPAIKLASSGAIHSWLISSQQLLPGNPAGMKHLRMVLA
jgi:hypothetical protein